MKSFILPFLFLFINILNAQVNYPEFEINNCKAVKENYLWAAETELTNFQYLEFLTDVRKNKGEAYYISMLPDTLVWREIINYCEPYVDYYFRHPAYKDYPLVGVSYEQVLAYCDWLEEKLNDLYSNDNKHPVQKLDVRLPSEEEWKHAARGGNPEAIFPWEGTDMRRTDKKFLGLYRANFIKSMYFNYNIPVSIIYPNIRRSAYQNISNAYQSDLTAPAKSYWPNGYGLYNMSGNVAEMIQEKGRSKGGSWRSRAYYLQIDAPDFIQDGTNPSGTIGFRYFIEVVAFKENTQKKKFELSAKLIETWLCQIQGNDKLLAGKYEVSNQLYNAFVNDVNKTNLLPLSNLWTETVKYGRLYQSNYTTHPLFENYPVVNISKENARAFCKWLTEKYAHFSNRKYKQIEFRLPTEKEWESMFDIQTNDGKHKRIYKQGLIIISSKGEHICNYSPLEEKWILNRGYDLDSTVTEEMFLEASTKDGYLYTAPVDSYIPYNGLYNLCGNVAEMISDEDITKGGSWQSRIFSLQLENKETYSGPSPKVGFRFVADLKTSK